VQEIGIVYLSLLVKGVDFAGVGRAAWTDSILRDAPRDPAPYPRP
jgi:hypothetical protein